MSKQKTKFKTGGKVLAWGLTGLVLCTGLGVGGYYLAKEIKADASTTQNQNVTCEHEGEVASTENLLFLKILGVMPMNTECAHLLDLKNVDGNAELALDVHFKDGTSDVLNLKFEVDHEVKSLEDALASAVSNTSLSGLLGFDFRFENQEVEKEIDEETLQAVLGVWTQEDSTVDGANCMFIKITEDKVLIGYGNQNGETLNIVQTVEELELTKARSLSTSKSLTFMNKFGETKTASVNSSGVLNYLPLKFKGEKTNLQIGE